MTNVSCIVEGHGEVASLPILLRRIAEWRSPDRRIDIRPPIRVHRDRFLNKAEEFSRHLQLAAGKSGSQGWILILLDADDDCPVKLGATIAARAKKILPHRPLSVVLAKREYEAWFIGSAAALHGKRGLAVSGSDLQIDPESPRDAKGWLRQRMASGSYGETTDQPAFSAVMDLQQTRERCRSFRKLCDEWDRHALA